MSEGTAKKAWGFGAGSTEAEHKEGWVANVGGATGIFQNAISSGEDSPNDTTPANTTRIGINREGSALTNGSPYYEWTGTWEDLGVPKGATVYALKARFDWKVDVYATSVASVGGPLELRNGSTSALRNTLIESFAYSATGSWATKTAAELTGLSDASGTSIKLRLGGIPKTATGSGDNRITYDYVVVEALWTEAGTPQHISITPAAETDSAQALAFHKLKHPITPALETDLAMVLTAKHGKPIITGVGTAAVLNELPPLRLYVLATAPSGRTYRWGDDGGDVEQSLDDLSGSNGVPGGYKDLSGTLPRRPGVNYGDVERGTHIEVFGAGHRKVWEGRLTAAPGTSGDSLVLSPAAQGYESHLTDDPSAQEIFIDRDLSGWGEPSLTRRAEANAHYFNVHGTATVRIDPTGANSGIEQAFGQMATNYPSQLDLIESWYDSGGVELGRVWAGYLEIVGGGGGVWSTALVSTPGFSAVGAGTVAQWNKTSLADAMYAMPAGTFYALLQTSYGGAPFGPAVGNWAGLFRNVIVFGRHGLTVYGTTPNLGLLASDVIAYTLGKWAPLLNFSTGEAGTIRPTSYPVPQLAFKEPSTAADIIAAACRFELPEWGIWDNRTFYLNQRGQRDGHKRWRVRVRPAQLEDTGQALDRLFNGVVVQAPDVSGRQQTIGPPGTALPLTDTRLRDYDPENPANQLGLNRYAKITLQAPATVEGMVEAGEAFLEHSRLLDGSGQATITGNIEDDHGVLYPYDAVKAGDLISFMDAVNTSYRYIVNVNFTRSSLTAALTIDAPPDSYEALMERLGAEIGAAGIAAA